MEIWWQIAVAAISVIAAGFILVIRRALSTNAKLRGRISSLDDQISALHRAVQEQQTARRELAHRAAHDPLTGLP
ncbi:MAG: hypothetical protein JXA67_05410, partial [Micromonosporaceae bacterium]|nr:hypothetical protein [Micromonosporaceae bacterium]